MADEEQVRILRDEGVDAWNQWREEHPGVRPNLNGADLEKANLREANLSRADLIFANLHGADLSEAELDEADLSGANLNGADLNDAIFVGAQLRDTGLIGAHIAGAVFGNAHLRGADLSEADLRGAHLHSTIFSLADLGGAHLSRAHLRGVLFNGANLSSADLSGANLSSADLRGSHLRGANLYKADLSLADLSLADLSLANLNGADLREANLEGALLIDTGLYGADLTACRVYGVSAWGVYLAGAKQTNLIITPVNEPAITVDNLEVAQFIYLLLNNKKIRDVIDTITSKVVLILGRFAPERKMILDALRETLRQRNYLPVLFDFDKPASRDFTETVSTLAHLARFVIADITEPKSIPQELQAIVPDLAVPVQPIIAVPNHPWGMFEDYPKKYHWVLAAYEYRDLDDLLTALETKVIAPAEAKARELMAR